MNRPPLLYTTKLLFIQLLFILWNVPQCQAQKKIKKPNIVLIYADDLGRGMLGTYGQKMLTTPNIDKLASQGMQFERAYGAMYCAPARASLLTGMHDCHGGDAMTIVKAGIYKKLDNGLTLEEIKAKIHKVALPAEKGEVFLGEIAQKAGYTTGQFGKLEWGFATTPERMERHGWDHHFGYYDHLRCHGFYPPFLFENGKKVDIPGNTHVDCAKTTEYDSSENFKDRWNMEGKAVYSEHIIMEKMLGFMEANHPQKTNKPFFIYFPTQLPHGPTMVPEVHPELANNPNLTQWEKEYASMVKMLDDDVGRIYSKLEEMEILDNTIIVFTSDNGHEIYYPEKGRTSKNNVNVKGEEFDNITTRFNSRVAGDIFDGNDGMSGKKRDNWEGGVRVPLFWYWKDHIKAGTVSDQMVSNYDFLNTLAEIVGVPPRDEKDGVSYAQVLFGGTPKLRDYTVYSSKMGPALVTQEGWKLRYFLKEDVFQLYYLPDDYEEVNDLAQEHPETTEKLKAILFKECNENWENGIGPVQKKV
ncbi:sulfatase-like hydrolase/transferase [Zobellia galactanivorans]|uniref:sulfatase-like hydrolase/transferase n=1 Tax=Zobellia galactanivorans (strain DSM 12802 / CCUG 47099 / CIP 106680 / NCIMB 13871 / Dsij) TaxID=63186 RepID=UPI0026E12D15|nr:sulfatase-like hydrolase/transferase [Zobellia galactanivorans]MDO6807368.1 sulfatase-like hydrolase/transferase [Zobellia galactanivorans]